MCQKEPFNQIFLNWDQTNNRLQQLHSLPLMPTAAIIIFTHCLRLNIVPLYSHLNYHHLSRFLFEDLHAHTQTLLHSHTRTSSDVPFTLTHKVLYNGIK